MQGKKIFLAKLAQGVIGTENSYLMGAFLVTKLNQMAFSRQAIAESSRSPFYLYIDEFHNFITPSMESILSGTRKYAMGFVLPSEVKDKFVSLDTSYTEDLDSGELIAVVQEEEVQSRQIKRYKIKEDWFFDKQKSVLEVRIVGIAPMEEIVGEEDGEVRGYAEMFWLYFPECRYVFANWDVFNRNNDSARMSFEDLFWKRMFSSYIIKESNVFDRRINQEYTGINALLESDKIKDEIFKIEHDLWHF